MREESVFVKRSHLGWAAVPWQGGVHVLPIEDRVSHTWLECVCGPDAKLVVQEENTDVGDVWMYVHHSLDGRERNEPAPGTLRGTHVTEEEPHG